MPVYFMQSPDGGDPGEVAGSGTDDLVLGLAAAMWPGVCEAHVEFASRDGLDEDAIRRKVRLAANDIASDMPIGQLEQETLLSEMFAAIDRALEATREPGPD